MLAAILRASIVLVPIAAAVVTTYLVRSLIPRPTGLGQSIGWWVVLLVLAGVVSIGVGHVSRRFTPLVTLLKLSMLFPDRAPSRFAVARQAGSVKRLSARLAELENDAAAHPEAASAATILALATALQSHDRRTRGHAERVRVYTDLLGQELGLSRDDRYRLRWAALLHDIGKLKISAEILNKPGKLDDHEWDLMRRHPSEGARIAGSLLAWLGPWAGAISDHHERYDGRGYPNGLTAESISLAGRIVAVADAYDTMTAARSYKRPMSVRAAREELANCAGGQFDPTVVRAFLAISLPRLVWRTGPLSYLAQTPLLSPLQEVGRQVVTVAGQGVAAATVAIGVTAAIVAPSPAVAESPHGHRPPAATGADWRAPTEAPHGTPSIGPTHQEPGSKGMKGHRSPGTGRTDDPAKPSPRPSRSSASPPPGGGGSGDSGSSDGSGSDGSDPGGSPSPAASPDPSPKPSPSSSQSTDPVPLPSVSVPPLPTPSLPLPSVSLGVGDLGG